MNAAALASPADHTTNTQERPPLGGVCYWFTGLSGAGKTTLAHCLSAELKSRNVPTVVLDGDQIRRGLNRDLGFSREDRRENVRRIAEVGAMLVNEGLVVLISAIAPYREDRAAARASFAPGTFFEVYVDTDLETCARRDPKALYAKAKSGEIKHFTGWDDPYEPPITPDFIAHSAVQSAQEAAIPLLKHLQLLQATSVKD